MNTIASAPVMPRHSPTQAQVLRLLMWREFAEHRNVLLWTPLLTALLALAMGSYWLAIVILGGEPGRPALTLDDVRYTLIDGAITPAMTAPHLQLFQLFINASLFAIWTLPIIVFGIAVYIYLLGALYDDRINRSVLFWRSLPVSDAQTVLALLITALIAVPALAMLLGACATVGVMLVAAGLLQTAGANPWLLWPYIDFYQLTQGVLAFLPVYALWALPTAGWLLLCSAYARSKPVYLAIAPALLSMVLYWLNGLRTEGMGRHAAGLLDRLIFSAWPSNLLFMDWSLKEVQGLFSVSLALRLLGGINLWIGALVGVALCLVATRLRSTSPEL